MLTKILKILIRSKLRGSTRTTLFLADRFRFLQNIQIADPEAGPLMIDLRLLSSHNLFVGDFPEIFEQEIMRRIVKPGMFVIDIGAHLGVHTILLSRLVGDGEVWAFEPLPECLQLLKQTAAFTDNVRLFPYVLCEKNGEIDFFVAKHRTMSGISNWTVYDKRIKRETRTLDSLLEEKNAVPDFVKCDIEGAELLCFTGAEKTLNRKNAPILLFESSVASKALDIRVDEAFEFLKSLSMPEYVFYLLDENQKLKRFTELGEITGNILAVPEAKLKNVDLTPYER